ncbi:MAG: CinA family protein [Butyrivibrio sp.]|nr:CinA family protein [Butyrivibrio sp.]
MIKMINEKYKQITEFLIKENMSITAMESCTSGLIASLLTDTEGSSAAFKGSFVTYSNEAKVKCGVSSEIIEKYGVYSKETAVAMADAARTSFDADYSVGVTGTFGNVDPANSDSIPGSVYFAISTKKGTKSFFAPVPSLSDRQSYKNFMADIIADKLLEILNDSLKR